MFRLRGSRGSAAFAIPIVLFQGLLCLLKPLNIDEHQFIAAAAMLSREGALPYIDFPFFHTPYVVFLYAVLDTLPGGLFLWARLLNSLAGTITLLILLDLARRHLQRMDTPWKLACLISLALILLLNSLFVYTSGKAWNHDLPVLAVLVAILILTRPKARELWFLSGCLIGLATGLRLTHCLLVIPFATWAALSQIHPVRKFLAFVAGFSLSLLPVVILFLLKPDVSFFGNIEYALINTRYQESVGFNGPITLIRRLQYLVEVVLGNPTTLILASLASVSVAIAVLALKSRSELSSRFVLTLFILPFLLAGSLAPSPAWYQYFYCLIPFTFLLVCELIPVWIALDKGHKVLVSLLVPFSTLALLFGGFETFRTCKNAKLDYFRTQSLANRIGDQLPRSRGRILTLGPIYAIEAGFSIYPELVPSPFCWRVIHLIEPGRREALGLFGPDELDERLEREPPIALLLGVRKELEVPLVAWAKRNHYLPVAVDENLTLYLPFPVSPPAE